jgi:DNA repair protein SbcD/Mre11
MEQPVKLLITDTHSDNENYDEIEELFDQAFDLADELGLDKLTHLGDAFTSRTGQSLKILLSHQKIAKKSEEREISTEYIAGNHDKTNLESEESYLDLFAGMSNSVHVIRRYEIQEDKEHKLLHVFIPYFKENTVYYEILLEVNHIVMQKLESGKFKMAFLYTHIAVNGVKSNGGGKVENELKYSMFKLYEKVFIGHYHNQSRIGKNIFYIGSGKPKDFGEDDKKGFTIVYNTGRHEFVQAKFKKYIKVKINLSTTTSGEINELIKKYKDSEDFVRFVFEGTKELFVQFQETFAKLKKIGIDVKTEDTNILRAMEAATMGGKITFNYKLILKYFLEYCQDNKDNVTPEKRSKGLKYINILKDYQDVAI